MMRNMKIPVEINEQGESTLDEIVGELERLGYRCVCKSIFGVQTITTWSRGSYHEVGLPIVMVDSGEPTTLAEIRSMNIETLKEM